MEGVLDPSPQRSLDSCAETAHVDPDSILADPNWLGKLSHEKRLRIRALHDLKPAWNWVAVFFPALWAVTAVLMFQFPSWPIRLLGYLVIGTSIHAMTVLVHEASHVSMFRDRVWDRWVGFLMGLPVLVSAMAYKVLHQYHHRHTREGGDPDEFNNVTDNKFLLSLLFYVWPIIGTPVYLIHVIVTAIQRGTPKEKHDVFVEYVLIILIWSGIISAIAYTGRWDILIHAWALPMIVAMAFGNIRGWSEHTMTSPGHPLTQTRTVTSNKLTSFLMCNLNYHLEHHLLPGIPWYNLPKVHQLLQDEYREANSYVYRSYWHFLWDAVRLGVHRLSPGHLPMPM